MKINKEKLRCKNIKNIANGLITVYERDVGGEIVVGASMVGFVVTESIKRSTIDAKFGELINLHLFSFDLDKYLIVSSPIIVTQLCVSVLSGPLIIR